MDNQYFGIFVGNGIATHVTLFYLAQELLAKNQEIPSTKKKLLILSSPENQACTFKTTSHVGTINARTGLSPLGDIIEESYNLFKNFFDKENPEGVYLGRFYKTHDISDEVRPELTPELIELPFSAKGTSISGYQSSHHIINPILFISWLKTEYSKMFSILKITIDYLDQHITDLIKTTTGNKVIGKEKSFNSQFVFLATGSELFKNWNKNELNYPDLSIRGGDFIITQEIDLGEESFAVMIEKANLVYRHKTKEVLIGGTTNPDSFTGTNHDQLKDFHSTFKTIYPELPTYNDCSIEQGLRVRGVKRFPVAKELRPGVFALLGLYKNGFTYPFLFAPKLVKMLIEKNYD